MLPERMRFFYGWVILILAWVCYGLGMSPLYYSWGNFAAATIEDLGLDRGDIGGVFGLFNILYQCVGVLVGFAQVRFGVRPVMTIGFLTTALGMAYLSGTDSALGCYIGFSVLGGIGIGFSTIIPSQTLAQNWFLKRRALAIGIILTAGGVIGRFVAPANTWMLENYDWRVGWMVVAGISVSLALLAATLVRDTPEQIGQHRDGAASDTQADTVADNVVEWSASQAVRTPQFFLMLVCGVAYALPWNVVVAHLNLHLRDVGYGPAVAAGFVGTLALVSIVGRLVATVGDKLPPQYVLAVALVLEATGSGILLLAGRPAVTYLSITLLAVGFGTAYVSVPVVFSHFFGRRAFSVTTGIRTTITGLLTGAGPWLAGLVFDATGAYTIPFLVLTAVGFLGAASAAALRHPGAPPRPESSLALPAR